MQCWTFTPPVLAFCYSLWQRHRLASDITTEGRHLPDHGLPIGCHYLSQRTVKRKAWETFLQLHFRPMWQPSTILFHAGKCATLSLLSCWRPPTIEKVNVMLYNKPLAHFCKCAILQPCSFRKTPLSEKYNFLGHIDCITRGINYMAQLFWLPLSVNIAALFRISCIIWAANVKFLSCFLSDTLLASDALNLNPLCWIPLCGRK